MVPERVMKLAGNMDCKGLIVQAILFMLLSRGWARTSSAMQDVYWNITDVAAAFRMGLEDILGK